MSEEMMKTLIWFIIAVLMIAILVAIVTLYGGRMFSIAIG